MFNVLKCRIVITRNIIISIQICCISYPSQKLSPYYYRKDNWYYNTLLRFWSCHNNSYLYWDIFLRVAPVVVVSRRVHWYLSLYTEVAHHTQYFSSINYNTSTITQHDNNHWLEDCPAVHPFLHKTASTLPVSTLLSIHLEWHQSLFFIDLPGCMFCQSKLKFKLKIFLNSE